jgi:molybdate transport repressor ModE-like protein
MQRGCVIPPACCLVMEVEDGVHLGYRRAVLLSEIEALGSLQQAAKVNKTPFTHALELVRSMNREFSTPLVVFIGGNTDHVALTARGSEVVRNSWRRSDPAWQDIQIERSRQY